MSFNIYPSPLAEPPKMSHESPCSKLCIYFPKILNIPAVFNVIAIVVNIVLLLCFAFDLIDLRGQQITSIYTLIFLSIALHLANVIGFTYLLVFTVMHLTLVALDLTAMVVLIVFCVEFGLLLTASILAITFVLITLLGLHYFMHTRYNSSLFCDNLDCC